VLVLKDDVTLCAEDRWCRDCERENERKLTAARSVDQSTSDAAAAAAGGSSSRGGSTSTVAAVKATICWC